MGFAALGFVTLIPLLIVVAAADPVNGRGFAQWVVDGLGVSARPARAISELFSPPRSVLGTTTALSLAALAVFGLTFGSAVQTGMEKVWDLTPARWHTIWRHAVWLASLVGYLYLAAHIAELLSTSPLRPFDRVAVGWVSGVLFFWWTPRLLLGGRIGWAALLPGAVATVIGLFGLRVFSTFVFAPLIVSSAVTYGSIGTVLVVQSWLIGVGFVVFGGALVGRLLYEEIPYLERALRRRWRSRHE